MNSEWLALALNDVLLPAELRTARGTGHVHLLLPAARRRVDLETLWTCGLQADDAMRRERRVAAAVTGAERPDGAARLLDFWAQLDAQNRAKTHKLR